MSTRPSPTPTQTSVAQSPRGRSGAFWPALWGAWLTGRLRASWRRDLLAGLVVALVAVPLAMALAIAVGLPPRAGIDTLVVAGLVIALFGGSWVQVSGPTAAFVVLLAPIVREFGASGLALATLLAGVAQMALGLGRAGDWIRRIPDAVAVGFTTGIGVVIIWLQLKDLLGLEQTPTAALLLASPSVATAFGHINHLEAALGVGTLVLIVGWSGLKQRWATSVPAPLFALAAASVVGMVLPVRTIESVFGALSGSLPSLALPAGWSWELAFGLLPSALAIAALGALESLLSATVADRMLNTEGVPTHEPNTELLASGVGNVLASVFGGFAATGAIARTAANVRFGGRTPLAAASHAAFALAGVVLAAPLLSRLPMAALAALLAFVAYRMAEFGEFGERLKQGDWDERGALALSAILTVATNMVIGVAGGLVAYRLGQAWMARRERRAPERPD